MVRKYKHVTEPESSWEASEESSPSWTTTSTWMETKPTTSSKWMETEPTTVWKERTTTTTTTTTTKKAAWHERKVHKNKNGKSKKHSKPAESNEFKKAIEYILAHNITGINGGNGSDYLM